MSKQHFWNQISVLGTVSYLNDNFYLEPIETKQRIITVISLSNYIVDEDQLLPKNEDFSTWFRMNLNISQVRPGLSALRLGLYEFIFSSQQTFFENLSLQEK